MRINWERLIPSLLILAISFLAARYLGTVYYVLYRAFALLLILDLVFLVISHLSMRYNQHFSSEHLIRGDEIHYDFYLLQTSLTASNMIRVEFFSFHNPEMNDLEPLVFSLHSHEKRKFSYTIKAGTRGIYKVGIRRLVMEDFMGFFQIPLPRHERTFYIYPRLFRGSGYPLKETAKGGERIRQKGRNSENIAFSNLREYRPGMPLRGISWKHFARYGYPVIRENDSSVRPGRVLMTDLRPLDGNRHREDGVLENLLTLTRRILDGGERVILDGISSEGPVDIFSESAFESLYQSTLSLQFDTPHLPLFRDPGEAVTLISALPDWDLLQEGFWQIRENWQLVAVVEGMEKKQKESVLAGLNKLKNRGVQVTIITKGERFWAEN